MEDVCLRFPTPAPTATAVVPAAVVPAAAGATGAAESAADCCVPAELSPMVPSGDGVGGAAGGWLTTVLRPACRLGERTSCVCVLTSRTAHNKIPKYPWVPLAFFVLLLCTYMEYVQQVVSRKCKRYGGKGACLPGNIQENDCCAVVSGWLNMGMWWDG